MPPCLLPSQLDTVEPPGADEAAVTADVTPEADKVVDEVLWVLHLAAARQPTHQQGPLGRP